jgi:hypothetical protein
LSAYGAFDIDSIPPVTTTSTSPARIIESAISIARIDDAHTLFTVSAGASIGSPAPTAAWRAGACPAPACCGAPPATGRESVLGVAPNFIFAETVSPLGSAGGDAEV